MPNDGNEKMQDDTKSAKGIKEVDKGEPAEKLDFESSGGKGKKIAVIAIAVVVVITVIAVLCISASGSAPSSSSDAKTGSGSDVAAEIGTVKTITWGEVDDFVKAFRKEQRLENESDWGEYLAQQEMSGTDDFKIEHLRRLISNAYIDIACDDLGVEVSKREITDQLYEEQRTYLPENEAGYLECLADMHATEEFHYTMVEHALKYSKLNSSDEYAPSEEELLECLNSRLDIFGGNRYLETIHFRSEGAAQKAIAELQGGASFASVKEKYNIREDLYEGWDVFSDISGTSQEWKNEFKSLSKGQWTSVGVGNANDYCIVGCTEQVPAQGYATYAEIPTSFVIDRLMPYYIESHASDEQSFTLSSYQELHPLTLHVGEKE